MGPRWRRTVITPMSCGSSLATQPVRLCSASKGATIAFMSCWYRSARTLFCSARAFCFSKSSVVAGSTCTSLSVCTADIRATPLRRAVEHDKGAAGGPCCNSVRAHSARCSMWVKRTHCCTSARAAMARVLVAAGLLLFVQWTEVRAKARSHEKRMGIWPMCRASPTPREREALTREERQRDGGTKRQPDRGTERQRSLVISHYQLQASGARSRRLETAGDGWRRLETGGDGGDGWGRGVLVRNSHVTVR